MENIQEVNDLKLEKVNAGEGVATGNVVGYDTMRNEENIVGQASPNFNKVNTPREKKVE